MKPIHTPSYKNADCLVVMARVKTEIVTEIIYNVEMKKWF